MVDKLEEFCLKILRKIKLGKLADIYEEHREGMRYLIFGALTTGVNIIVAWFTYYILHMTTLLSTAISILAAWIFAYITNKLYVFNSKTNTKLELFKEIASFVGCRIISAIIEMFLMHETVDVWGFNYMLSKIIVSIIVIILNYIFSKLIIFKGEEKNG